jgi:NDP-sugar pyrophosphorylase family protein
MQCAILAGGLGTRMRPLTETCPKTLLPDGGRPFAWHQLPCLAAQGITEVIYSIGHPGEMIWCYCTEEPSPVPSIRYVDDQPALMKVLRNEGRASCWTTKQKRQACITSTMGFPAFAVISGLPSPRALL